jgi:hypothetical protein
MTRQLEQIFSQQGFAAGKEYDRNVELGQVFEELYALFCIHGGRFSTAAGSGIAVYTVQVALAGAIPDHHRSGLHPGLA